MRTGTNYLRSLVEINFKNTQILVNDFVWKHDLPKKIKESNRIKYLISVKNPYSWINSYSSYLLRESRENLKDKEFPKETYPKLNDEIIFEKLTKKWNEYYGYCLKFIEENPDKVILVKYEDLIDDFRKELERIREKFGLKKKEVVYQNESRIIGAGFNIEKNLFNKGFYLNKEYLKNIGKKERKLINKYLDQELMKKLGYELIS